MAQPLGLDVFFNQDAQGLAERPRRAGAPSGSPLDEALVGRIAGAEGLTPAQQRVMNALLQQESGYGRNTSTSVNGAQGAGQIIPDTFRRYAKPGERIDNPEHNLAVMARIVKDLGGKTGDDPARIATGYFSGEGNIAREGAQAWKNDAADGNGKRVSGYVTDVVGRLGSVPEPAKPAQAAGPDLSKAPAWSAVKAKPEFLALSKEDKAAAKQAYFDYWIAPNGGDDALRQKFMATADADGLNAGLAVEQFKSGVTGLQSGYYSNAARNNASILNAMDRMDRGERVPIDQDPVGYADMNPEQRKAVREQVTGSFAGSAARAVKYAGEQKQYKSNPAAKVAVDLADKGDFRGAWNAFKSDPAGVIQQLSVESAPNAIPAAIAAATGLALGGGVAGFMTGLAGGSFPVEFVSSVAESLRESGVNMEDYAAVEAKLRDPEFIKSAGQRAVTRGSVIAASDMASGGLALPLKAGLRQIPKNLMRLGATGAAEISTEMAGEAAAQAATGEEFKVGQILAEGLGAGPQTVGLSLAKTVAEAAKKPETVTPDGRIETAPEAAQPPPVRPAQQPIATRPVVAPPVDQGDPPAAPPASPLQQTADTIVEELAQQAGIPRETVLPTAPIATAPPVAADPTPNDSLTEQDVLDFVQTRRETLTLKRDGERVTTMGEAGPVDSDTSGQPLTESEQDELALIELAGYDAQAMREYYGLDGSSAPAAAAPEPTVPGVEPEIVQNEAPAPRQPPDDLIQRAKAATSPEELTAISQEANARYPDSDPLGDTSNDDDRAIAAVTQAAAARFNELETGLGNQQETNATQPEQVAGQAAPAQGAQDGAGTAAPPAGAQDVRQPGAANERLINTIPLEENTEIQVIDQPGGITVRVFDKDAGEPAPGVRVFPKDREQDALAYADELAVKSTPKAPKTEKEAKAKRAEGKWFGTDKKAQDFIAQQGIADTHEVFPNNNRFEIRKKEASSATPTGQVATQDVRPESDQPLGDAGVRQGAGGSTGGVVAAPGAPSPGSGSDRSVPGAESQSDGALRPRSDEFIFPGGTISAKTKMAFSPDAYKEIYGRPGGIVNVELTGEGVNTESKYKSVAGIVVDGEITNDRLMEIARRVAEENARKDPRPKTGGDRLDQRIRSDVARKNGQQAPEPKRGQIGGKLAGGEVVLTNTGRKTTPFPKINTETERKAGNTVQQVNDWLLSNALAEAQSRGDRFNERQFQAVNLKNPSQSDKDSAEQYLFGETIPPVVPSILKPLTNPSDSPAVNDFLEGRRPDAPTYDEVSKEAPKAGDILFNQYGEDYRIKSKVIGGFVLTKNRNKLSEKRVQMDTATFEGLVKQDEQFRRESLEANKAKAEVPETDEKAPPQASTNTVFTEDAAAKAREILKRKLSGSQLNSGIDPEVMQAGITLAGYHIEKGARTFAAYAKAMIGDLGDVVRPYLKSWYMGVKYDPRAAGFDGMDSAATVDAADAVNDPQEDAPPENEKEARNRRAQPVEPPSPPPQKEAPNLAGRKVKFDVMVEDTGQTASITVDAASQMKEFDERESVLRELIACLQK